MRKKFISSLALTIFLFVTAFGCNTNKPAEEAIDAKERVKKKVEDVREDQKEAAEETGVE